MCSTATHLSSLIPQLQPSKPRCAAQDSLFTPTALPLSRPGPRPKMLVIDYTAGVSLEAPIPRNDGSYPFLKLEIPRYENGSIEDVRLAIQNGTERDYDRFGWLYGCYYYYVIVSEYLKELEIKNGNGYDYFRLAYTMLAGLEPRRTENGVLVRAAASPIGIPQLGWDIQMAANGDSELVNMDSIHRAFDFCITQNVRFMMASSSPKENNFNFFSHNNINFNGRQHIGQENPSGPTTEDGSGKDGGNGRLPPSGGSRGGGGKNNNHGDDYDDDRQFSWIMKFVAEKMKEVAAEATKAEKAEAAKKSMGTLELISRLVLLVVSCLIFGNPTLADPSLLFKVCIATQVLTGSCFSTFTGLLDVVLTTCACMGLMPSASGGFFGHVQHAYSSLPSSILKGGSPGFNISLKSHVLTYFYKVIIVIYVSIDYQCFNKLQIRSVLVQGILFGTAGLGCGLICHAIVNLIRAGSGNAEESEEENPNPVSFIVKNAVRLGVFLLFAWIPVIGLLNWKS